MEENAIKVSLNEIVIEDLDGIVYDFELNKILGNLLFVNAQSIEVSDIARKLHKGECVEISVDEIKEITIILAQNQYFKPWAHQQIIKYFTDRIPELKGAE